MCIRDSLFGELAVQSQAKASVIKFVNLRETGGWSREGHLAAPKMAALLAAAHLPDPDPVPTVTYTSAGRLLVIGPLDQAQAVAALLADSLDVTLFAQGPGHAGKHRTGGFGKGLRDRTHRDHKRRPRSHDDRQEIGGRYRLSG